MTNTYLFDKSNRKNIPGFILGLFEGDGSVLISVSVKPDNTTGFRVRLSFSIALHEKDINTLHAIKAYLGVGVVEVAGRNDTG